MTPGVAKPSLTTEIQPIELVKGRDIFFRAGVIWNSDKKDKHSRPMQADDEDHGSLFVCVCVMKTKQEADMGRSGELEASAAA